jgi:hypothetical protein
MIVHVNNIESDNHDLIIGYSNTTSLGAVDDVIVFVVAAAIAGVNLMFLVLILRGI